MKPSALAKVLEKGIPAKRTFLIVGKPGIGKTAIPKQVCKKIGWKCEIFHPIISDPTDWKGMPWVFQNNGKPRAEFIPFGGLERILNATEPTLVFFDDFGQAPPLVQATIMQPVWERQIDDKVVPDCITFIVATNRRGDKAAVSGVLEPFKSRAASIIELDVDTEDWIKWATDNDIPAVFRAFIRWRPQLLDSFEPTSDIINSPVPRTVENAARLYEDGYDSESMFDLIKGAAGEAFATEFFGYERLFKQLPNPRKFFKEADSIKLPNDPAVLYALTTVLPQYLEDGNENRIITIADRLMDADQFDDGIPKTEFAVFLMKNCEYEHPEFMETRAWIEFQTDHKELFLN